MFSCRTRGFCPSCHAKRLEEWAEQVALMAAEESGEYFWLSAITRSGSLSSFNRGSGVSRRDTLFGHRFSRQLTWPRGRMYINTRPRPAILSFLVERPQLQAIWPADAHGAKMEFPIRQIRPVEECPNDYSNRPASALVGRCGLVFWNRRRNLGSRKGGEAQSPRTRRNAVPNGEDSRNGP